MSISSLQFSFVYCFAWFRYQGNCSLIKISWEELPLLTFSARGFSLWYYFFLNVLQNQPVNPMWSWSCIVLYCIILYCIAFFAFLSCICSIQNFLGQGLNQSCSCWPTPQLMATPDNKSTERGQGCNPHLHGYQQGSLLLSHNRTPTFFFQGDFLPSSLLPSTLIVTLIISYK